MAADIETPYRAGPVDPIDGAPPLPSKPRPIRVGVRHPLHGAVAAMIALHDRAALGGPVDCPDVAAAVMRPHLYPFDGSGARAERLVIAVLDTRLRILATDVVSVGSHRFTVVDPPQILTLAFGAAARAGVVPSAILMGHNHPSGDPSPSAQDREVTVRMAAACRAVGLTLADHLVITADRYTSLRAEGAYNV